MEVKIGLITIRGWEKDGNWRRLIDDDYGSSISVYKISHKGEFKEYVPAFFGKLEFLKEHYKLMYGDIRFKTLHDAKNNIDLFLIRFNNLKAFI